MGILTVCMFGVINFTCMYVFSVHLFIDVFISRKCSVYVGELLGHQYIHHGFR